MQQNDFSQSRFTGGLLGLVGINILQWLLTLVTFGIGTPWALCLKEKWMAEHTVIDGRRLRFDGTGSQLFGKFIVWALLTVVTLGIYGFWMDIKMKQWVVKHTHMV